MMKIRYFTFFCVLTLSISCQNDLHNITIKIFSKNLNPSTKIYITGNTPKLGDWQPNVIELENKKNYWEKNFKIQHGELIEYKFTKGTWESEALDENGKISNNHQLRVTKDTTLTYTVNLWNDGNTPIPFEGQITGKVVYHSQMKYEELLARDIVVWLPPGYDENPTKKYPVLYMHDGQNLFDPQTSFTKTDWQIDEAADSLIEQGKIECFCCFTYKFLY